MATLIVPLAVGLASRFVLSLLTPTKVQEGQRLDDLDVPKSEFGYNMAKPFGKVKFDGCNMFWATAIEETSRTSGGGKGQAKTRTYRYRANFAVNYGWDQVVVTRIWLDGKLAYNPFSITSDTATDSINFEVDALEIFGGTDTQLPAVTLELVEGVGEVPGFRQRPYMAFRDLDITEEFGRRIPKVDVEVIGDAFDPDSSFNFYDSEADEPENKIQGFQLWASEAFNRNLVNTENPGEIKSVMPNIKTSLAQVLRYVCNDAGLVEGTDYDIEYDRYINGCVFKQNSTTYKEFIEDLQRAFGFITVSEGGKLRFIKRDACQTPLTLVTEDLATHEDGEQLPDRFKETRTETTDLPSSVIFEYKNVNKDHQRGIAQATRFVSDHKNELRFNTDVVMSDSEALTAANDLLYQSWIQRQEISGIRLLPQYIDFLQPGYRLDVPIRGEIVTLQVSEVNIGANFMLEVKGLVVNIAVGIPDIDKGTDTIYQPQDTILTDDSLPVVILDIPLIRDTDVQSGVYAGVIGDSSTTWSGGAIVDTVTTGTNYEINVNANGKATYAEMTTEIPYSTHYVIDENTVITVEVKHGTLEGISDEEFLASIPLLVLVGDELIGYRDVTLVSGNVFQLSHLLRGLYGTELSEIDQPTQQPQRVYFVNTQNYVRPIREISELGTTFDYKALYNGESVTSNTLTTTSTYEAIALRPYAPNNPTVTETVTDDYILEWTRRTRLDGGWKETNLEVPLNEQNEQFDVEILDASASTVLRTVTVLDNVFTYANADIITDFGSLPTTIDFNVYQISANFGRGRPLEARDIPVTIHL